MKGLSALLAALIAAPAPSFAQAVAPVRVAAPVAPSAPVFAPRAAFGPAALPGASLSLPTAPSLLPSLPSVSVAPMARPAAAPLAARALPGAAAAPSPALAAGSMAPARAAAAPASAAPAAAAVETARREERGGASPAATARRWNAVFDGTKARPAASDPVLASPAAPSRSGLKAAAALSVPAGLKVLAPALPYAGGAGILAGTWFAIRGTERLIGRLAAWRGWAPETATVARLGAEVVLWAVGGSAALRVMGLDWNTVFASLGVGGLAVTLATKEFLGNLIRGVVLMVDSPVRVGDLMVVDKKTMRVADMTFRYVVLEEAPGQYLLLTYSSLASQPFTILPRPEGDTWTAPTRPAPSIRPAKRGPVFWGVAAATLAAAAALGWAVPAALPYLYAVAELGAAGLLERLAQRLVTGRAEKKGWSPTGTAVTRLGLSLGVWTVGLLTALRTAGVSWSALLAGAGVLGVAVGVAASDIIANLINAVYLLVARPFRVGDTVGIGAVEGKVVDMTLRFVVLETEEGGAKRRVYVPYPVVGAGPLRLRAPYPPAR